MIAGCTEAVGGLNQSSHGHLLIDHALWVWRRLLCFRCRGTSESSRGGQKMDVSVLLRWIGKRADDSQKVDVRSG